ncbi:Uncharacterized protein ToN1_13840 [Aromatoleum petrolei]|nr:Uncharacterized protein ToN1_13840 [Aromatoleum petrolei]
MESRPAILPRSMPQPMQSAYTRRRPIGQRAPSRPRNRAPGRAPSLRHAPDARRQRRSCNRVPLRRIANAAEQARHAS